MYERIVEVESVTEVEDILQCSEYEEAVARWEKRPADGRLLILTRTGGWGIRNIVVEFAKDGRVIRVLHGNHDEMHLGPYPTALKDIAYGIRRLFIGYVVVLTLAFISLLAIVWAFSGKSPQRRSVLLGLAYSVLITEVCLLTVMLTVKICAEMLFLFDHVLPLRF